MENLKLIVFLVPKEGKQIFHVGPPTIKSFWDNYYALNEGKKTDVLSKWIETVPPTLRSKIEVYEEKFIDFKEINFPKMKDASHYAISGIMPINGVFNPFSVAKTLAAGTGMAARGLN